MEELEIVAILNMADGNKTVGTAWLETKVFPLGTGLIEVIKWAQSRQKPGFPLSTFNGNLRLTINQG